jgi:hypothetical protein
MRYFLLHVLYEIEVSGKEIVRSPLKMQGKVSPLADFTGRKKVEKTF